jgi:hypothetical protein
MGEGEIKRRRRMERACRKTKTGAEIGFSCQIHMRGRLFGSSGNRLHAAGM